MDAHALAADVWDGLGGDPGAAERLTVTGPEHVLPSVFEVTAAAAAAVSAATLAAAEAGGMTGAAVVVDTTHAALAFRSEHYVRVPDGPELGTVWDPVAGDYPAADGWIRLHTNFRAHRAAALRTLGLTDAGSSATAVGEAVAGWPAEVLADAVHAAGGCAAALRSADAWRAGEQAAALAALPLVALAPIEPGAAGPVTGAGPALAGVRVLDLTRVIAGPVAGRFLAAHGAEVLRVDGPDPEDVAVLVVDTTVGKRSTVLDLAAAGGRDAWARLLASADVVLSAYRPGALAALGLDPAALALARPGVVVGTLSAYGGVGPWGGRRGFDSLVQMVTGIADEGRRAAGEPDGRPVPLPAQILDHASGYLLAAGVLRALAARAVDGVPREAAVSLARTAAWLDGLGRGGDPAAGPLPAEVPAGLAVELRGPWGRTRHVRCPGTVAGSAPAWASGPAVLGADAPAWAGG
jgi:hypothetical protein